MKVSKDKPTLITTVPTKRYYKDEFDEVHKEVNLLNNTIRELVYLIYLDSLKRARFTMHCLHLNSLGKSKLVNFILKTLNTLDLNKIK